MYVEYILSTCIAMVGAQREEHMQLCSKIECSEYTTSTTGIHTGSAGMATVGMAW